MINEKYFQFFTEIIHFKKRSLMIIPLIITNHPNPTLVICREILYDVLPTKLPLEALIAWFSGFFTALMDT
jgi:hypothetical protein